MSAPKQYRALKPANQFSFKCPIFSVETKFAACFRLEQMIARGDRVEVRQGCQVCLRANLCPVRHVTKLMFRTGKEICHSDTPKTGKLPDEVLDRIRPIMVVESHFNGLAVSPSERTRIEKASGLSGSIPKASGYTVDSAPSAQSADAKVKKRKATPKPEPKTDVTAAQTGDMSAAVNAAMEGAA